MWVKRLFMGILKNVHEPLPEVLTCHIFFVSCICWFSIRCHAVRDLEQCRANSHYKRAIGKFSNAVRAANQCLTGQVFFMQNYFVWCDNETNITNYWLKFIHSIGMCRMRQFLAVLRSFFRSSLLCTFCCHPSTYCSSILPHFILHLFLDIPLSLLVPKFIYNPLFGILFSSILWCTCPNQRNIINLIVSLLVNIVQFSFSLSYTGPKIQVSDVYVNVLSVIVFFSLNFSFFYMFLFLNNFCSIKHVWEFRKY